MGIKHSSERLSGTIKKSAVWTLLARVLIFIINLVGTVILARLLEPEDFGIFGIGLLFVGLTLRFGNLGFSSALVQKEDIEESHISSLFVVNFCLYSTIAVLLMWASPSIGRYFDSPTSGDVLFVLATLFFLYPFSSVARALLHRSMQFKVTSLTATLEHYVGVITSIGLAWNGFGVWSLVYSECIRASLDLMVLMFYARWWPRFSYKHSAMKDLFSFGIGLFFQRLLAYCANKVDVFIIGRQLGVASLGFYERAFGLMNMTIKELANRIAPVLFRAFSMIQNDQGRILAGYKKVLLAFSLISYPIFFGVASVASPLVYLLYGEKWMPSVIPLQILCFSGPFRLQLRVVNIVMNAMGKIRIETGLRAAALILMVIGCLVGSKWGITGVATVVTLVSGMLTFALTYYFSKLTQLNIIDLVRPQAAPLIASGFMYAMVWLVQNWVFDGDIYSFITLISTIIIGGLTYAGVLFIIRPPSVTALFKELCDDLKPALNKFKLSL